MTVQLPSHTTSTCSDLDEAKKIKSTLMEWFETNDLYTNKAIFDTTGANNGVGIKAFDCFYVDVANSVIAFRIAKMTPYQRRQFYNDPYERFVRRDQLVVGVTAEYSTVAPEPNYNVAVYGCVPFDIPLRTLREANVDDYCMECTNVITEIQFMLDYPNAIDIMAIREKKKDEEPQQQLL